MSHSVHGEGKAPLDEDVDQGQGIDEQASHNVPNLDRVGPQVTPTNIVGSSCLYDSWRPS